MDRYICIHGHFYQPPRENPWLEEVEMQDSAQPFHDWNERITAQCYGPNATSRILDPEMRIIDIVNNYSKINFNFGPTLLSWMERHQPHVYEKLIEADRLSQERFGGHGSAVAQVYNHMIMPLADKRDKYTQALWGVTDFKKRFGRDPEGMWLPETAVDVETLEILAELGIKYTILAPRQASRVKKPSEKDWQDVSEGRIDPSTVYLCRLPSGRSINLFFYDGPISQDLAFGQLLESGAGFKERLTAAFTDEGRDWPQLVHIAMDGETFGHHHLQGEMALSYCLHLIESDESVHLTNYGQYLAMHPPVFEVEIFENSSWSCIHGVERWRSDCGCNSGLHPGWKQTWRNPLRQAVNWLAGQAAQVYEEKGPRYFIDPWKARNQYIEVMLDRSFENVDQFLHTQAARSLSPPETVTAVKLLEMERFAQLIFTSCAWFFDEISGIETVQILQYAARAIQLLEELSGRFFEEEFIERLKAAPSNLLENGGQVYEMYARPTTVEMLRVGAHYAISSLFEDFPEQYDLACYEVSSDIFNRAIAGRSKLVTGKARITSKITREFVNIVFAALHPGDHNVTAGVNFFRNLEHFREMERDLRTAFEHGNLTEGIRKMDEHFEKNTYSLWHLFRDEQRKVVNEVLEPASQAADAAYREIFSGNYTILNFLEWLKIPPPSHFLDAAQYVINTDLKRLFKEDEIDVQQLEDLIKEARKWSINLENEALGFFAANWVNRKMEEFEQTPHDLDILNNLKDCLVHLRTLPLGLHLWKAQNIYFSLGQGFLAEMKQRADQGDEDVAQWLNAFLELGALLKVRLA